MPAIRFTTPSAIRYSPTYSRSYVDIEAMGGRIGAGSELELRRQHLPDRMLDEVADDGTLARK